MYMTRVFQLIAACLIAAACWVGVSAGAEPTTLNGTVDHVVDGDTVRIISRGFQTTIRLIGIDTPETKRPGYPVQCGGPQASAETKRLLPVGSSVRVVSDPSQDARDKYNRFLGYVYPAGGSGARGSVNYRLVAGGFAKAYIYGGVPFQYATSFLAAEATAKRVKRGIWGPPCNGDTTKPASGTTRPGPSGGGGTPRAGCDPNYSGACIPSPPPDLDCRDISARRFRVIGTDVHRFDVDGDGIACEG